MAISHTFVHGFILFKHKFIACVRLHMCINDLSCVTKKEKKSMNNNICVDHNDDINNPPWDHGIRLYKYRWSKTHKYNPPDKSYSSKLIHEEIIYRIQTILLVNPLKLHYERFFLRNENRYIIMLYYDFQYNTYFTFKEVTSSHKPEYAVTLQ